VIKTIGEDLTPLTPARGFSVDIMSGVTVVLGSLAGIPLSTTHCKVGAVVSVGLTYDRDSLKFDTFKNILAAWLITVPASAAISALLFVIFKWIIPASILSIAL
jgi:sodium-dependent phosphate transporter